MAVRFVCNIPFQLTLHLAKSSNLMPLKFDDKQKSLKRRFLLILGAITGVCVLGLGLMILFWKDMLPQLTGFQRTGFGVLIMIYAVLRFARLLKKDADEV